MRFPSPEFMNCHILFRRSLDFEYEFNIAKKIFKDNLTEFRSKIPDNSLVIPRYSCLPFYEELERELSLKNCKLINSYSEHSYIAEMSYYHDIDHLTPRTWFNVGYATVPYCSNGWVVKGKTNSRKHKWNSHMFASNRDDLKLVSERLYDDILINDQGLIFREYIPLRKIEEGINGLPFTNEWRFFFYMDNELSHGFYWSNCSPNNKIKYINKKGKEIAHEAAKIIKDHVLFFVIDVAETENGDWIVIEVNDGQMSGLSENDPSNFYKQIKKIFFNN